MKREKGTLYYCQHSWDLYPDNCPCDVHFVEYLESRNITGKSIFHFGTGEHHIVGKKNHERGNPNDIFGITASYQPATCRSKECETYLDFIYKNPVAANHYKVLFSDVYTLSPSLLPDFDIVTLFHLCEFYDEEYSSYARLNDLGLLEMFLEKLKPSGQILFFPSWHGDPNDIGEKCKTAKATTVKMINDFVAQSRLAVDEEYKSILICSKPEPGPAPAR